jgi:single-strand DNA-binding protein
MNNITIIGNLGQDPEVKYFESGKVKASFSVGVKSWDFAEKKDKTNWFNVEAWEKKAQLAGDYLKKGSKIAINGSMEQQKYTNNEGIEKTKYYIRTNEIELLTPKNSQNTQDTQVDEFNPDEIPF